MSTYTQTKPLSFKHDQELCTHTHKPKTSHSNNSIIYVSLAWK